MKLHRPSIRHRFLETGPILALVLVLGLPLVLKVGDYWTPETAAAHARIAEAVDEVPWNIGGWTGQDVPVPAAAEEMLRPNALLSRRYRRLGADRSEVTVVIVHCRDVRDMYGHYPPVCYPNVGWTRDVNADEYRELSLIDDVVTLKRYRFTKTLGSGVEEELRVFSFFVMPDGQIVTELDSVRELLATPGTYSRGVAQVQCVRAGSADPREDQQVIHEVLNGMSDLFAVLRNEQGGTLVSASGKKEGGEG